MSGNDSMVVIKTENEIAKRTILNVVGEVSGAFIKVPKEELVLEMEIESQIMMLILKALIIGHCISMVSIDTCYQQEEPKTNVVEENVEEENIEEENIDSKTNDSAPESLKERVISLVEERGTISNAEIVSKLNCDSKYLSKILSELSKDNVLERINRGVWQIKKAEDTINQENEEIVDKEEEIPTESIEDSEKQEIKTTEDSEEETKTAEESEEKVSEILEEHEEVASETPNETANESEKAEDVTTADSEDVSNVSTEASKEPMNQQVTEKEPVNESSNEQVNIFEETEYANLVDYIMQRPKFSVNELRLKFPEEVSKISVVINKMNEKYIRERKDSPGTFEVINKARVLYYILKNPGSTFYSIKANINTMSAQVISDVLNNCLRNRNVKMVNKGYVVIKF